MKTIYIAGAVTGLDRKEVEFKFDKAEKHLLNKGYIVRNPTKLIHPAEGWNTAMRKSIMILCKCDAIALLPDWHESKGAVLENTIAKQLELESLTLIID
jgi:hypothetical protein